MPQGHQEWDGHGPDVRQANVTRCAQESRHCWDDYGTAVHEGRHQEMGGTSKLRHIKGDEAAPLA